MDKQTKITPPTEDSGFTRRRLFATGAAVGVGAAVGAGLTRTLTPEATTVQAVHGSDTVPFYGKYQAGIATEPAAHVSFLAFDLDRDIDKSALVRLMRLLTDSASRLTQGEAALADTEPELASKPARLTVTFGFGPRFVQIAHGTLPPWLKALPPFAIDELSPQWSDGDLVVQISADDQTALAHAVRVLSKDARSFGRIRWRQDGFRHSPGTVKSGTTMRNLFGQVDGTVNPAPGTQEFERAVWCDEGWWTNGTSLVLRRIAMDLESWDPVSRIGREEAIGRRLSDGAPLTGEREHDDPDFTAKDDLGLEVIAPYAHIRRARSDDPNQVIFRRPYNYDDPPTGSATSNTGLLFASFQADVSRQFVPIQQRLAELDMLNEWTTAIGSAVFVVPPGCSPDGFIGDTLLT